MVAGVRTQWDNMHSRIEARDDIEACVAEINPYKVNGLVEKLPGISPTIKGNLRSFLCGANLLAAPPLDAVWTQNIRYMMPFALTKGARRRIPLVHTTDCTSTLLAEFGGLYPKASGDESASARLRDALDRFCYTRASMIFAWSSWAAASFHDDFDVPWEHLEVIPPGVDLARWHFRERVRPADYMPKLLFVGGDFERKGGEILVDVFRDRLQGRCELHLVTKKSVPESPGIHVYTDLNPNDPDLLRLYEQADIFVLPTLADCFSLASMEAMAAGLPVITSRVGGIPEIVDDHRSGFLIAPGNREGLADTLETLVARSDLRASMGLEGRKIVEARFDAAHNTDRQLDRIIQLATQPRRGTSHVAVG